MADRVSARVLAVVVLLGGAALAQEPGPVELVPQKLDLRAAAADAGVALGPHGLPVVAGMGPELPYEGGPVPEGYAVISRPRNNLIMAGEATFALSYAPVAVVGLVEILNSLTLRWIFDRFSLFGQTPNDPTYWSDFGRGWMFLLPVVGPLYAIPAGAPAWVTNGKTWPWPVYASIAAVQAVGFTMAIVADRLPVKFLRKSPAPLSWQLVPMGPGAVGASIVGAF